MFAIRMNLGDPHFVNINNYTSEMLSASFADQIRQKILDNTTFPPDYYMNRYKLRTLIIFHPTSILIKEVVMLKIFISKFSGIVN